MQVRAGEGVSVGLSLAQSALLVWAVNIGVWAAPPGEAEHGLEEEACAEAAGRAV